MLAGKNLGVVTLMILGIRVMVSVDVQKIGWESVHHLLTLITCPVVQNNHVGTAIKRR